jgi:hypothetical protein
MANEFVAKNGLISQNNSTVTGSLIVTAGITGSLQGTSSWANNAVTSSYAANANTASYVANAQTASYVLQAVSASFATTASYALTAAGGSGGISQGKVVAIATGYSNLF